MKLTAKFTSFLLILGSVFLILFNSSCYKSYRATATSHINQVEAGGTVTYGHTLANNGNVDEIVVITATNSQPGWTNGLSIDTDVDGVADTPLNALTPGQITVQQTDGTTVTVTVTDGDGDGIPSKLKRYRTIILCDGDTLFGSNVFHCSSNSSFAVFYGHR